MTLLEYKLEHLGKILYRPPTVDDWYWDIKEYESQYYLGNEKPKHVFVHDTTKGVNDIFCDDFDYKQISLNTFRPNKNKVSYYFSPAPIKPKWVSDATDWRFRRFFLNTPEKTTLLELEKLTISHQKHSTINTTYHKCLITTPHDNKTYIEWVHQKWVEPISPNVTVEELKARLLLEHKKENNIK